MTNPNPNPADGSAPNAEEAALVSAFEALLEPLAALAVARGLSCPTAEALMRRAWVQAASRAHDSMPSHRRVSRIATATGLSRREVTRLTTEDPETADPLRRPLSSEVFARWLTDPATRGADGRPARLPRVGPAPSFEALAQSVTKDVHPRAMLEELQRLGLVRLDPVTDEVQLRESAFVPRGDRLRMLELLAANTSDHLRAAVDNVLGSRREHLEQAVFADELSRDSLQAISAQIKDEWQDLMARLLPTLENLIAEDARLGRQQDQRVRIGLFSYSAPMEGTPS